MGALWTDVGGDAAAGAVDGPMRPRHLARMRLGMAVLAGDIAAIFLAFVAAWLLTEQPHPLLAVASVIAPIHVGVAVNANAYAIAALRRPGTSIGVALQALALAFGALFLIAYLLRVEEEMSRALLAGSVLLSALFVTGLRFAVARVVQRHADHFVGELLIQDSAAIRPPAGMRTVIAADIGLMPDLGDPIALDRFAALVRGLDRIVVVCPADRRESWAIMLRGANVQGELVVDDLRAYGGLGLSRLGDHATLLISSGPLTLAQRCAKRAFDLALTLPALVLLMPLLLLVAAAVKLDSRGPVFFRQRRVGRGNAFFNIVKFRSMHVAMSDADGRVSADRADRRVTRVGRFIRKASIDELPQLLNVVSGAMSLVGPRPHALGSTAGDQLFWEVDHRYWHRHACKPGLTGLAQVRGFRGATHRREDLVNRLQADLEYLNGWSIWRDLSILLATFRVLVHRNAF